MKVLLLAALLVVCVATYVEAAAGGGGGAPAGGAYDDNCSDSAPCGADLTCVKTKCAHNVEATCTTGQKCVPNASCPAAGGKCTCDTNFTVNKDKSACNGASTAVGSTLLFLLIGLFISRLN